MLAIDSVEQFSSRVRNLALLSNNIDRSIGDSIIPEDLRGLKITVLSQVLQIKLTNDVGVPIYFTYSDHVPLFFVNFLLWCFTSVSDGKDNRKQEANN